MRLLCGCAVGVSVPFRRRSARLFRRFRRFGLSVSVRSVRQAHSGAVKVAHRQAVRRRAVAFFAVSCGLLSAVRPRARHRPRGGSPPPPCLVCHSRGYPRLTVDKSAGLTHAAALDNSLSRSRSPLLTYTHTYAKKADNRAIYDTLFFLHTHTGLKIPWGAIPVPVRPRSSAPETTYKQGLSLTVRMYVCIFQGRSCTAKSRHICFILQPGL